MTHNHGFDLAELERSVAGPDTNTQPKETAPRYMTIMREHGRYLYARLGNNSNASKFATHKAANVQWRSSPMEGSLVSRAKAEEIASFFPGRAVAIEADVVFSDAARKERADGY